MTFKAVRSRAREYFGDVAPSHDWHHVKRVTDLATSIASDEDADPTIVKPAALLHDIGRGREDRGEIDDHATWGATEARSILERLDYPEDRIQAIAHCIRAHRYSNNVSPETLEARVLADADNLDALGAVGIARTFCYSGENERVLADGEHLPHDDTSEAGTTGLNHLVKKILHLKDRMYTATGREIAGERHDVVKDYVDQLMKELPGQPSSLKTH